MAASGQQQGEKRSAEEAAGEEPVLSLLDVVEEHDALQDEACAVLGGSDADRCSYPQGYVKRQALYACNTCTPDKEEPAGICLACTYKCHEGHDLFELYTKRNFRCDCGNGKFKQLECKLYPDKEKYNANNKYNNNFFGLYCTCKRPYPDPEDETPDEMIQCIVCEDWFHGRHLGTSPPEHVDFQEMVCQGCMERCSFLWAYSAKHGVPSVTKITPAENEHEDVKVDDEGPAESADPQNDPGIKKEEAMEESCESSDAKAKEESCEQSVVKSKEESCEPSDSKAESCKSSDVKAKEESCEQSVVKSKEDSCESSDTKEESCKLSDVKAKEESCEPSDAKAKEESSDSPDKKAKGESCEPSDAKAKEEKASSCPSTSKETCNGETSQPIRIEIKPSAGCRLEEYRKTQGAITNSTTYWPSNWRKHLCCCAACMKLYAELEVLYLLDDYDTVQAYEHKGQSEVQENKDPLLTALSSMDRVQQVELIYEYNDLKTELKDYLKRFADEGKVVSSEDIQKFFEDLRSKKRRRVDGMQYYCS